MKLVSGANTQRFVANVPLRVEGIPLVMQNATTTSPVPITISIIAGVGLHDFPSTVDTGSTGLAVVLPGNTYVERTTKSCKSLFRPCMKGTMGLFFTKCFGDLTGYQLQSRVARMT